MLAALFLASQCVGAWAARPLVTDDARIVDPQACQLEAYVMRGREETSYVALPACNPWGNAELTLGGALVHTRGDTTDRLAIAQVKTVLRSLDDSNYGVAFAAGITATPSPREERGVASYYFYVPLTIVYRADTSFFHFNLGANHVRNPAYTAAIWGVANETYFNERFGIVAETFGNDRHKPFFQLGGRVWIVPQRWQVDATYGMRYGGGRDSAWISIGIRLLTPPFL